MRYPVFLTIASVLLMLLASQGSAAEVHPKVRAALNYEIPQNTCKKPNINADVKTVMAPAQNSGSTPIFEGSNTSDVSDVDTYTRKRAERKEKRYRKCVDKYKKGILKDIETLKASAQYGLTQEQANTILAAMKRAQEVYMTPDGVLPEQAAEHDE